MATTPAYSIDSMATGKAFSDNSPMSTCTETLSSMLFKTRVDPINKFPITITPILIE